MSETPESVTPATDEASAGLPAYKSALIEDVEEAMRDVVDPELGVNVVDLGLVYGLDIDTDANDQQIHVRASPERIPAIA